MDAWVMEKLMHEWIDQWMCLPVWVGEWVNEYMVGDGWVGAG